MNREEFVSKVLEIAAEKPDYKLGGDGSKGVCDCVGLIIGAIRRCGIIYDDTHTHGSNHIARHDSDNLRKIERTDQLQVGDCAFKAYNPGDSRWDLPEYYNGHPDQRDYYHIGVVTSTDPLQITHMTSPTIKVDNVLGRWEYAAQLKQLKQKTEDPVEAYRARVTLKRPELPNNGLIVRPTPGSADELDKLKHGEIVTVRAVIEDLAYITQDDGGPSGYVTKKYLVSVDEGAPNETEKDEGQIPVYEEAVVQIVITDSAGDKFYPNGSFTVEAHLVYN